MMTATSRTVGLAEGIIDDTCLVLFTVNINSKGGRLAKHKQSV